MTTPENQKALEDFDKAVDFILGDDELCEMSFYEIGLYGVNIENIRKALTKSETREGVSYTQVVRIAVKITEAINEKLRTKSDMPISSIVVEILEAELIALKVRKATP